mgnify:CR=1 FL=1
MTTIDWFKFKKRLIIESQVCGLVKTTQTNKQINVWFLCLCVFFFYEFIWFSFILLFIETKPKLSIIDLFALNRERNWTTKFQDRFGHPVYAVCFPVPIIIAIIKLWLWISDKKNPTTIIIMMMMMTIWIRHFFREKKFHLIIIFIDLYER